MAAINSAHKRIHTLYFNRCLLQICNLAKWTLSASFHSMNKLWGVPNLNYKTFNHISGNYKAAMNIRMNIQEPPSLKTETKRCEVNTPQEKKAPKTFKSTFHMNQYCCVYFTPITIPGSRSNVTLSNLHFTALFLSGVV